MGLTLSATQWRQIARLARNVGDRLGIDLEEAQRCATDGLLSLVGGSHVLMVIHRRTAPRSSPLGGFRAVFSHEVSPDADTRRETTLDWATNEPKLDEDPVLRRITAGAGTARVVCHRDDTAPAVWDRAPDRRLLEELGLEDRVNAVVPLGSDMEVSFCIDRPRGDAIFNASDGHLLLAAVAGLRPLAAMWVRVNGFVPSHPALSALERRAVQLLLTPAHEDDIAASLDVDSPQLRRIAAAIYRKWGANGRLGLMNLCHTGASPSGELAAATRPGQICRPARAGRPKSRPLVDRVRSVLEANSDRGGVCIEEVARRLHLSVRTMQRQLRSAGSCFRELADLARQRRAEALLARPELAFTDIALRLGYGQVTSFNRAVKRWTGKSPGQLRRELLDKDSMAASE